MRLIKTRPKIQLMLPAYALPGARVAADVLLDCRRAVPVERIDCTLIGTEKVVIPSGQYTRQHQRTLCAYQARLSQGETLPAGRTKRTCTFDLPAALPPTHQSQAGGYGVRTTVEYVVRVHCAIPWWPDATREFVLVLQHPPVTVDDPGPSLHATSIEGPVGREPHVEFSLDTRFVTPGDTLRGELALSNVDFNRYKLAHLSLVGMEKRYTESGRFIREDEVLRYAIKLDISQAREGDPVPFAMKLPDDVPPSYRSALWDLGWRFEVKLEVAWSQNLTAQVPITVLPRGSRRQGRQSKAVPTVGSERVARIWQAVAGETGLRYADAERRIVGRVGDVALSIARAHRGADGIFTSAELSYPDLALDIDGGVAGSLRRIVGGGVALGDPDWDKRHYLTGREEAQIAAFGRALQPHLSPLILADIDDHKAIVEQRDAGQTHKPLAAFARAVHALAGAIPAALAAVPPPRAMQPDGVDAWQRLAKKLGGPLRLSDMHLGGRFEGADVTITSEWTPAGAGRHTSFAFAAPDLAPEKSALVWADGDYRKGDPSQLPKKAQSLLPELLAGARSLTVDTDRIVLWDERIPIADFTLLEQRLAQLAALAAALHGRGGPYR